MLGIPLGLAASNATEWLMHKYVLHGLGRKKDSFWALKGNLILMMSCIHSFLKPEQPRKCKRHQIELTVRLLILQTCVLALKFLRTPLSLI